MTAPRLIVTLCTYNERENLGLLIPEIHRHAPQANVLVIDDGSPDGTGELADQLADDDERIHVLHRAGKLGLGTAILAGFRYGIEQGYDLLINLDADFSHPPEVIPRLLAAMDHADVAVASRYIAGGGVEGWGWHRHFMSRGINVYARLLLGLSTRDNSGSYRCYRVAKLAHLDLARFRARGYAFQEEILYRCRRVGCRFEEVPFVFAERRFGSSKINLQESVSALWVIFRLGLDRVFRVPVRRAESTSDA